LQQSIFASKTPKHKDKLNCFASSLFFFVAIVQVNPGYISASVIQSAIVGDGWSKERGYK